MSKNYWLHRIKSGEIGIVLSTTLLFEKNILSIGWSDFSTESFIDNFDTEFKEKFEDWGNPRNRWCLYRFLIEMKKGDVVLVPTPYEFSLFEIVGERPYSCEKLDLNGVTDWNGNEVEYKEGYIYQKDTNRIIDIGFFWDVRPIKTKIPRGYADGPLYSRMKIQQINSDITSLSSNVEDALNRAVTEQPLNLYSEITENTCGVILEKIRKMPGDSKFEELVRLYFEHLGARVEVPAKNSSRTEDGDTDAVAYFEELKVAIRIQAKWHEGTTSDDAVKQIVVNSEKYQNTEYHSILWVISSCDDFSDEAIRKAEEYNVRLINGKMFAEMLLRTGIAGLETI